MGTPMVSIIVPVYNSKKYLNQTVQSVLDQTYHNWEMFLIDDGSTDGSSKLCDYFAETDSRITAVHQKNAGVSSARNKGISLASGEWVEFLDSDDYIKHNMLERMIEASEDVDMVVCSIQNIPSNDLVILVDKEYSGLKDTGADFENLYMHSFYNLPTNKIYRRSIMKNKFLENLSLGEDLLFNLEYMRQCNGIKVLSDILFCYRHISENSLSKKTRCNISHIWEKMISEIDKAFDHDEKINDVVLHRFIDTMIYKFLLLSKSNIYSYSEKIKMMKQWRNSILYKFEHADQFSLKYRVSWYLICHRRYNLICLIGRLYQPV